MQPGKLSLTNRVPVRWTAARARLDGHDTLVFAHSRAKTQTSPFRRTSSRNRKIPGAFFISGTRTYKCSSPVDCAVCRKSHLALPEGEPRRFAQNGFSDSFKCPLHFLQRALDFFRYSAGITGTGYPRSACRRSRRRRGCWRCSWRHIPSRPPAAA